VNFRSARDGGSLQMVAGTRLSSTQAPQMPPLQIQGKSP
jgi:hypothetical protein